jgi:hypothetical protein
LERCDREKCIPVRQIQGFFYIQYVCRCRCFKFFVSLQVPYFNGSVNKHDSNNEGLQRPKGMAAVLRRVARVLGSLRGVQHHETSQIFGSQICPPTREIKLGRAAWYEQSYFHILGAFPKKPSKTLYLVRFTMPIVLTVT